MRGNQPINIEVICDARGEERIALLHHFLADNELDEEEMRLLAIHDQNTSRLEQALACIKTGVSWLKSLTTDGNGRAKDLTAQYVDRYGEPIAAD